MATSTWRTTYTPGSWIVLNGPKALVAAQPTSADIAERLSSTWNDVVAAVDLESLVGKLMRWGMDVVPDLIVVVDNDRLQCVVRGDVTVTDVATGEVVANGHGQAAWRSVNLDARHIAIALPGQDANSTWRLPLAVGVVSAGSIDIDARDDVRVDVGDTTFFVAPLTAVPVVTPAPATPVTPEAEAPAEAVAAPTAPDLPAPGAWATGFGVGAPLSPVVALDEPEPAPQPEPAVQAEPEPAEPFVAPVAEPELAVVAEKAAAEVAEATPEPVAVPEAHVPEFAETPAEMTAEQPAAVAETVAAVPSDAPVPPFAEPAPEHAAAVEQTAEPVVQMPPIDEQIVQPAAEPFVAPAAATVEPVMDQIAPAVVGQPAPAEQIAPIDQPITQPVVEPTPFEPTVQVAQPVDEPRVDSDLATQIEAAKAAVDQAIAESQGVPVPEPVPAAEQAEVSMPIPEPVAQVAVEPVAAATEAASAQPDLDRVDWRPAEVQFTPEPAAMPEPAVVPEPAVPQSEAAVPQPVATEPQPTPTVEPLPAPVAEPQPTPAPDATPEPAAAPEPDAEPLKPAATGSPLGATLLVFSDGQRWPVNEPLLVGRAPQAYPGETAHLVRVVSPHHDISRTHVRIELYDGAMWATDRESTNGTTVHNPGQAAATAQPGQPMHVWVGGIIDIGDGVSIRVQ